MTFFHPHPLHVVSNKILNVVAGDDFSGLEKAMDSVLEVVGRKEKVVAKKEKDGKTEKEGRKIKDERKDKDERKEKEGRKDLPEPENIEQFLKRKKTDKEKKNSQ